MLNVTQLIGFGAGGEVVDSWSVDFDGSNDYLELADNAAWDYGTGDFTIEGWFNFDAVPAGKDLIGRYGIAGASYAMLEVANPASSMYWYYANGAAFTFSLGFTISTGTWYHFAVCRSGTSLRFFVDGVQKGSTETDTANYGGTVPFRIGNCHYTNATYFDGKVSNVRVVKGTALYTAGFTPSTTPLTAVSNTQLLTCQNSTIVDNSSNAFSITNSGGATVSNLSPFG